MRGAASALENLPIKIPILNRFGNVFVADRLGVIQICERPRNAQHFVVGPRAEAEASTQYSRVNAASRCALQANAPP